MQLYMLCKVENVSLTNRFYTHLFGPDAVEGADDGLRLFVGDTEVDFYPRNPDKPRVPPTTYPGFILAVPDGETIEDFRGKLEVLQAAFHFDEDDRILTFTDPDGYAWQVYVDEAAAEGEGDDETDADAEGDDEVAADAEGADAEGAE